MFPVTSSSFVFQHRTRTASSSSYRSEESMQFSNHRVPVITRLLYFPSGTHNMLRLFSSARSCFSCCLVSNFILLSSPAMAHLFISGFTTLCSSNLLSRNWVLNPAPIRPSVRRVWQNISNFTGVKLIIHYPMIIMSGPEDPRPDSGASSYHPMVWAQGDPPWFQDKECNHP